MNFEYGQSSGHSHNNELRKVQHNVTMQLLQLLIGQVNEECFKQCVPKPGRKLEVVEQNCLDECSDKYIAAMGIVKEKFMNK